MNVEDACAFAWLQLLRYRPERSTAFGWLCTTAIREAIKLDRRAHRVAHLAQLAEQLMEDPRQELDRRLELLAAGRMMAAARLRPRERRLVSLRALGHSRPQGQNSPATPTAPSIASWGARSASWTRRAGGARR